MLLEKAKRLARERKRSSEAIEINTEILEIDPRQVGSYTRRGACFLEHGNLKAAAKDYRDALGIDPNNKIAANRLEEIVGTREEDELLRRKWRSQGLSWSTSPVTVRYGVETDWREETPLYELGYSIVSPISRRNRPRRERWKILMDEALPVLGLQEVAWTIANNCRVRKINDREKYAYAIAQWEHDLARLKRAFYHEEVASWSWPSTNPG